MYLEAREPLVLNYNPFIGFKDDPQNVKDQVIDDYMCDTYILVCTLQYTVEQTCMMCRFSNYVKCRF